MTYRDPTRRGTRASERVSVEARVDMEFPSFQGFISEVSANLSTGGMFVRSDQPPPPGTVLAFTFRLKDESPLVQGTGRVVWTREADLGPAAPMGMGVRFLSLEGDSAALVARIVEQHRVEGGDPFQLEAPDDGAYPGGAARYSGLSTTWPPPPDDLDLPPEEPEGRVDFEAWQRSEAAPAAAGPQAPSAAGPEPFRLGLDDGADEEAWEDELSEPYSEDLEPPLGDLGGDPQAAPDEEDDWSERVRDPWGLADLGPDGEPEPIVSPAPPPVSGGPASGPSGTRPAGDPPRPETRSAVSSTTAAPARPPAPAAPRPMAAPTPPPRVPDPRLEGTGSLAGLVAEPEPPQGLIEEIFVPPEVSAPPPRPVAPEKAPAARRSRVAMLSVLLLVMILVAVGYVFHNELAGWLGGYDESLGERVILDIPPPATLESAGQAPAPPPARQEPIDAAGDEVPPASEVSKAAVETGGETGTDAGVADPLVLAPPEEGAKRLDQLRLITWKPSAADGTTVVTLLGNGQLHPEDLTLIRLDGRPARELLKLRGINWPFREPILDAETAEVRRIRTGFHPKVTGNELHIVLDLSDPAVRLTAVQRDGNKILLTLGR